eukprot:8702642-Ditylum_brightwellii.AAC.1
MPITQTSNPLAPPLPNPAEIWNLPQHNNLPTLETLDKILPDEEWRKWKKKVKLVNKDAFLH